MATLPETPFNGVVVDRDVSQCANGATKVSLIIMQEENPPQTTPVVVTYSFVKTDKAQPTSHLRVGHKVRIKEAYEERGFIFAKQISYQMVQFAADFMASKRTKDEGRG